MVTMQQIQKLEIPGTTKIGLLNPEHYWNTKYSIILEVLSQLLTAKVTEDKKHYYNLGSFIC